LQTFQPRKYSFKSEGYFIKHAYIQGVYLELNITLFSKKLHEAKYPVGIFKGKISKSVILLFLLKSVKQ